MKALTSFRKYKDEMVFAEELEEAFLRADNIKSIIRHVLRHRERIEQMINKLSGRNKIVMRLLFVAIVAVLKEMQTRGRI